MCRAATGVRTASKARVSVNRQILWLRLVQQRLQLVELGAAVVFATFLNFLQQPFEHVINVVVLVYTRNGDPFPSVCGVRIHLKFAV